MHKYDKNGVIVGDEIEGQIVTSRREWTDSMGGTWHHYVTTMEPDLYGGRIERKYMDGRLTDFTRTAAAPSHFGQSWTDPLSHP